MGSPMNLQIHHRDSNGLNNQKENLVVVSGSTNTQAVGIRSNNTTGFVGVGWDKRLSRYRATIKVNYRQIELGRFRLLIDAVNAYNNAALHYFGPDAYINPTDEILIG